MIVQTKPENSNWRDRHQQKPVDTVTHKLKLLWAEVKQRHLITTGLGAIAAVSAPIFVGAALAGVMGTGMGCMIAGVVTSFLPT